MKERDPLVVGLPRGGVVVAAEVADALHAPLDIVVVRKVAPTWNPELAVGAAGEGGVLVRNDEILRALGMDHAAFQTAATSAVADVEARGRRLRGDRRPPDVAGRNVIVVDDGIATGATAEAAIRVLGARGAARVVLAVPVATPDAIARLQRTADEVVVVDAPRSLGSVGAKYRDFGEVTDEQVLSLLQPSRPGTPQS
jgi:putative phosphoribosyl transferase